MAEETPAVRNKGLLITALVLAALVVVIYNWHVAKVRSEAEGETVRLLMFSRNMEAGEPIGDGDLVIRKFEKRISTGLGDVVEGNEPSDFRLSVVQQPVPLGDWLRWSHIRGEQTRRASGAIRPGTESFTIAVEPRMAPGTICSVGDKVVLLGKISLGGAPLKSYRIIEGVRVLAIGGVGTQPPPVPGKRRSVRRTGQRSYRSLTIETTPETALQLDNVLSHVQGPLRINVLSPADDQNTSEKPRVAETLRKLTAAVPARTSGTMRR